MQFGFTMEVWVAIEVDTEYGDARVIGIFSSFEKAKNAILDTIKEDGAITENLDEMLDSLRACEHGMRAYYCKHHCYMV